jgi:hypothetical protein
MESEFRGKSHYASARNEMLWRVLGQLPFGRAIIFYAIQTIFSNRNLDSPY